MKDMKKTAALLAAMALLGVGSASAAEAAPMYALKGITVTATRQAESLKDVPANVQVITEKDIKLRNVQTASECRCDGDRRLCVELRRRHGEPSRL